MVLVKYGSGVSKVLIYTVDIPDAQLEPLVVGSFRYCFIFLVASFTCGIGSVKEKNGHNVALSHVVVGTATPLVACCFSCDKGF